MMVRHRQPRARIGSLLRLWLVLCVLPAGWAHGQDLAFHPPANAADPTTSEVMRDLALRVLPVYQESDADKYLANLSALQLVAQNYPAAWMTRQSLRDRRRSTDAHRPAGRQIIFDMYARAKANASADRIPFARAFTQAYRDVVPKLSNRDAFAMTGWLEAPVSGFQQALQKAFDQRRAKGTVPLADAIDLVWAYLTFDAYRSFAPLAASLDAEDDRQRYVTDDDVRIATADGVMLSARLVRPRGDTGPLPTLLEFTLRADAPSLGKECAAHGYVGVIAYARGIGKSTGAVLPFQRDGDDVRAVIDWIAKQPWSDRRVAMYGSAYSGFAAWAAARRLPSQLKAIATTAATAPGIDFPMTGSIFHNAAFRWVTTLTAGKTAGDDARWRDLDEAWYRSGRPYRQLGQVYGKPNRLFTRWLNHPSYDRFWQKMIPYRSEFALIKIPVLTTAGYFGQGEVGALYYFDQHRKYDPRANHTLLIGPYDDDAMARGPTAVLRGVQIDEAALIDLRELRYQWFDSVLKGAPLPERLKGRVNYEVMGANQWLTAASIEDMSRGTQRFYLDAKVSGDGHLLSPRKGSEATFIRQSVSLSDRGDAAWTPPASLVGRDPQTHNGLTFISEPLRHEVELSGQFSGRLDFTVNKMDVDLNVTFYELLPGGDYIQLFDPPFEFRASYARDRVHRRLLKAGERQQLAFRSERLMSRRLQSGSRIVIVLGVNKRPDQEINYGSGDDVSAESIADSDGKVPVRIKWYSDSYIDIPVRR